jgi:3-hydroxyisobutyrate dehydrogenase
MASNLVKAGHSLSVYDLVPEAVEKLVNEGARAADNPGQAVEGADFVVTMLPAGKHVAGIYLGEDGLLQSLDPKTVVIDSSTIDAETSRSVGQAAREMGIGMMDCPVSGGVAGAAAGTLSFMCGGAAETFEKAKPILECMGAKIFHAGDHGAGQIAKMCNNMLLSVLMVGTSEALRLGQDNGLDPKVLSEIMGASSGKNWTLEVYNPCPGVMENVPSSNDYKPGFMVDLMCKDLNLALENALQNGSSTPMGALARSLYTSHARKGNGKRDFSSIFEFLG